MKTIAVALALLAALLGLASSAGAEDYDSLIGEAQAKYAAKEYKDALDLTRRAFAIGEPGVLDYYNGACVAALAGDADQAFEYLHKAVGAGMVDPAWDLDGDSDLASLKSDGRWEEVKAAMRSTLAEMEASLPETRAEGPVLDLPEPLRSGTISVEEALQNRRSIRSYADSSLTLAEVSQLLWSAYGINHPIEGGPAFLRGGLRTAPAAGALYPLEIYLVARRVADLPAGTYWYNSEKHQLVAMSEEDHWTALAEAALDQPHFETAAAAIVYSAVFERNTSKYGQRGRERYVCMDLGHSAENVYLQAYALKIGTCAIGAFIDIALRRTIGMTREEEPLYIMPLGRIVDLAHPQP
jgi:SagB-type dehydrogenase family enzyme